MMKAMIYLTFRHNFNLQSGFDGGVLEISSFYINSGEFTDITEPADWIGSFVTGGYNADNRHRHWQSHRREDERRQDAERWRRCHSRI